MGNVGDDREVGGLLLLSPLAGFRQLPGGPQVGHQARHVCSTLPPPRNAKANISLTKDNQAGTYIDRLYKAAFTASTAWLLPAWPSAARPCTTTR